MILLKENPTADINNAVFINAQQDIIDEPNNKTLTRYSIAFTNTAAVTVLEVGGVDYAIDSIDVSTVAGADAFVEAAAVILNSLGYQWEGEKPFHYKIVTTVTTFYSDYSEVVLDEINDTVWVAGATTSFGVN